MIVCSCNVLSDKTIRACLAPGPDCPYTPAQVYRCLGCSPQCGRCARTIRSIVDAELPSVHGDCTTRCSAACPLTVPVAENAAEEITVCSTVETVEIIVSADMTDVCEPV